MPIYGPHPWYPPGYGVLPARIGWSKVRKVALVRLIALFWQEAAVKREMHAEFSPRGRGLLIGRGAKRERDLISSLLCKARR